MKTQLATSQVSTRLVRPNPLIFAKEAVRFDEVTSACLLLGSSRDEKFLMADDQITKVQPDALKKPGFAIIQGMPCRIAEINHKPKATANGNKRLHLVGTHIHTGKKYDNLLGKHTKVGIHSRTLELSEPP